MPGSNVWAAKLPSNFSWPSNGPSGRQLRVSAGGAAGEVVRARRARHPNGDPERSFFQSWFYTNTVSNVATPRPNESYWLPPNGCPGVDGTAGCKWPACAAYARDDKDGNSSPGCAIEVPPSLIPDAGYDNRDVDNPAVSYGGGYGCNATGGGATTCGCSAFDPPYSLWCGGFGGNNWQRPSGLHIIANDWNDTAPWIDSWAPLSAASKSDPPVVHGMDWGHWASLMFEVVEIEASADKRAATLRFGKGGFQGAQGGNASNYYLENVKELLDDGHEFCSGLRIGLAPTSEASRFRDRPDRYFR